MKNYQEKLLDPRWQKKRLEIFERDRWTCQNCGREDITLHIHHCSYFSDAEPWEYNSWFLITLCAECHESEPEQREKSLASLHSSIDASGLTAHNISVLEHIVNSCHMLSDRNLFWKLGKLLNDPEFIDEGRK